MRESLGKNSGIREFSFVLTKKLLALTERKRFFSVYIVFEDKLRVSKESIFLSRVEGSMSRVEGTMSRVIFFSIFFIKKWVVVVS